MFFGFMVVTVVPRASGRWEGTRQGLATTQYAAEFGDSIYAAVMHAGGWTANMTENPVPVANLYGTLESG